MLPSFKSQLKIKMCLQTRSEAGIYVSKVFSIVIDAHEIWLIQKTDLIPACGITCYIVQRSIGDEQEFKRGRHDSKTLTKVPKLCLFTS